MVRLIHDLVRLPLSVWVGCLLVCGAAGVMCGFAALKPQLLAEHVYADLCSKSAAGAANSTNSTMIDVVECEPQLSRIDRMYQMGIVGATFPCVWGGMAIDRLGPRGVGLTMAVLYGAAVFTVGRSSPLHDLYTPAFFVVGAAGGIYHMTTVCALQRLYPSQLELTSNVLTVMWDLSALVPVLFTLARERWNVSVHFLLSGYGLMLMCCMAAFCLSAVPAGRLPGRLPGRPEGKQPPGGGAAGGAGPSLRALCSGRVAALCAAMACNSLQGFLYLGTADEQLHTVFVPQQTRVLLGAFSLMLPLLSIPNVALFDAILTRCSIPAQWLVLALTNVAWATCAMLPWARLQYATFFLYTFWRMFTWVTLFATVGRCYPNDSGTVAGMAQSVTGLVLLLQEPLRASNLRLFPANFVPLQLGLTLLAATSSCLCARAFWALRSSSARGVGGVGGGGRAQTSPPSEEPWERFRSLDAASAAFGADASTHATKRAGAQSGRSSGERSGGYPDADDDGFGGYGGGAGLHDFGDVSPQSWERRPLLAPRSEEPLPPAGWRSHQRYGYFESPGY